MAIIVTHVNTSLDRKNSKTYYFEKKSNTNKSNSAGWLESDRITLSPRKHDSAGNILTHQVVASLNKAFDEHQIQLDDLFPQDSNPKTAANRILSYIEKLLAKNLPRTMNSMEGEKLFESIKNSFEDGFIDSSKYLSSLGLLNEKTSDALNNTYRIVRIGIEKLHLKNSRLLTVDNFSSPFNLSNQQGYASFKFELTSGQSILVDLNELRERRKSETNSVQGQYKKNRMPILDEILKYVDKLASDFIKNDTYSALKNVKNLGYKPRQLARFTLNMHAPRSVKAISTYKKLNPDSIKTQLNSDLENTIRFIQDLKAIILNSNTQQIIKRPEKSIPMLFTRLLNNLNQVSDVNKLAHSSFYLLSSLLNELSDSIKEIT